MKLETLNEANDDETLALLKARLSVIPANNPAWVATDNHGGNIMQMVALFAKTKSMAWLLSMPFASELKQMQNLEGETPLEYLENALEASRIKHDMFGKTAGLRRIQGSPTHIRRLPLTSKRPHIPLRSRSSSHQIRMHVRPVSRRLHQPPSRLRSRDGSR